MPTIFGVPVFKLFTLVIVIAILWQMFELWKLGRQLSRSRDDYLLARHRGTVACIGCLTVIAIVCIELQVRMSPAPYAAVSPWLFWVHLMIDAALLVVGATIVFRFNGLRSVRWHGTLAYAVYALFFLSFATGSWMLYQLPL
jgi:hypothetical protein